MAFTELSYEKVWTSPEDFPTIETSETKVREDMQYHPDAIKDFINGILLPEVAQAIEAGGGGGGGGVPDDGSVTTVKIADGAVTREKLANAAVGGTQIENGSITLVKLAQSLKDYITNIAGSGIVKLKDYTLPAGTHDFAIDVSDIDWSAYRTVRIKITGLVAGTIGNNSNDTDYRILFNNLVPSDTEGDSTYNMYMGTDTLGETYVRQRLSADDVRAPEADMGTSGWYEMAIRGGPGVDYITFNSARSSGYGITTHEYAEEAFLWGAVRGSNLKLSGLNTINFVEQGYSDGQGGTIRYGIAAGARVCIYGEPI